MEDAITRALRRGSVARRMTRDSVNHAIARIDDMLDQAGDRWAHNAEFLRTIRDDARSTLEAGYGFAKASVLVPAGLFGLSKGLTAPDMDIRLLGIGKHRYFLFHSALGLVALRHLYRLWAERQTDPAAWHSRVARKFAGTLLGAYAVGVGVHLGIDVFQPKAVIFPFFGSLVDGTLVDDRIWLLANSIWAFHIARDIFVLSIGSELEAVRAYVQERFAGAEREEVWRA